MQSATVRHLAVQRNLNLTDYETEYEPEYGILWGLSFRAMKKTSKISFKHAGWLAIAIVVLYAMSDEWHQTFTPSREGTIRDVIIDTLGASIIFGMVVLMRKKLTFKQK